MAIQEPLLPSRREELFPERLFQNFFAEPWPWRRDLLSELLPARRTRLGMMFSPSVDVKETDNEVRVDVEVPGLTEKDVEVTVTPEALSIRGEKREERTEEQKERGYLLERSYGTFERRIPIPSEIDQEKVQANFDRGVLTIHLPKTAASQSRAKKIQITCGEGAKKARPDGGQPSQRM